MEQHYLSLAFLTAGVCVAMGTFSLAVGFSPVGNKNYLYFGAMCWLMVAFIFAPPIGFIVGDPAPYSNLILFKRAFIFLYYAAFPWFIYHYSGQTRKILPSIVSAFAILSYFVMFTEDFKEPPPPLWTHFALGIFASTLAYGYFGAWKMHRSARKTEAMWLGLAMTIYFVLFVQSALAQVSVLLNTPGILGGQLSFPIHLHALTLALIVGMSLYRDAIAKLMLERVIESQRTRWKSFLENLPLLIIEVTRDGAIISANDFATGRLGLKTSDQLIGMNWFDMFTSVEDRERTRSDFEADAHPSVLRPVKGNFKIGLYNPITVNWLTLAGTAQVDGSGSIVLVGQDLTTHESARIEVEKLKQEIEKENLIESYGIVANSSMEIIGSSKAIGYTLQKARQVAATNAAVLLEGETGVGKELFADYIQAHSLRKDKPFIKVNCSAMPSELIEDELFGHEKGAFTSALSARTGRFELADGGTILLDEIGELPMAVQPKLLRVLQQGEFERIGGQKTIRVDVRIIAATNRDLNKDVVDGKFRSDLLYRLNVFPISIPALRNRKEDLSQLIGHFINKNSEKYGKTFEQISKADIHRLQEYPWPGNIRELQNLIERSVIQSNGDTLKLQWLDHGLEPEAQPASLEEIEREHILKVLNECNWKINGVHGAAEKLDMNPNTLRSRMKKLNIGRDRHSSSSSY